MPDAAVRTAMVLAAGLGTRLRPLTDHLPKPLAPVLNRPLLDLVLDRLAAAGATRAVVNTHHLPELIAEHLRARAAAPDTVVHHEPEILGTAGPLHRARALLGEDDAFLLHNADVWCGTDLRLLTAAWAGTDAEGVLLLTDLPRVNSVRLGADGLVRDVAGLNGAPERPGDRGRTYTGVALLARRFLDRIPPGRSGLAPALAAAAAAGDLHGVEIPARAWSDLGTPRSYLEAHAELLATGERIVRGAGVEVAAGAVLEGFVALGDGARVGPGAVLSDCVVLPGTEVGPGRRHRRVLGPGWEMPAFPAAAAPPPPELHALIRRAGPWTPALAEPLTGQASDRRFWRLRGTDRSAVLMDSAADPSEFHRTTALSRYLHAEGLGGPEVLAEDALRAAAVLEDLGDRSLGAALAAAPDRWRELYGRALAWIADLQAATATAPALALDRVLDRDALRWESQYFAERFLRQECGLPAAAVAALDPELDALAAAVAAQPRCLIHRDCQSTNLLLHGGRLHAVDVQGMRLGPVGYDVASLLRDPYVDLPPDHVRELLADWEDGPGRGSPATAAHVVLAGLQRSMQALGAYGFLSRIRGKTEFRRWIPAGLRQLRAGLAEAPDLAEAPPLPRLTALVARLEY